MKQRELKFRAWDNAEKVMKDPFTLHDIAAGYDCGWRVDQDLPIVTEQYDDDDPETIIMQYTGLKDKNGKEIYEGDFIKYGDLVVRIMWDDFECAIVPITSNHRVLVWELAQSSEVIGNVFENPELLEE
jgi:hypothetical protein